MDSRLAKSFRREQWLMLLATMFCYLFFYTGRHNFGWAAKGLAASLDISYVMVGWISSAMLLGYATGQLINGNLADRFSPRIMITLGGLLSVATNLAISFSTTYAVILTLWAMNGYFQSMAWAPGSRLISNWWRREERGKAFGFYTMAAGSSSVITFLLSIVIIGKGVSWNLLFRIPVLFLLFAVIVFFFIARSKPSDKGYPDLYTDPHSTEKTTWRTRYAAVLKNRKFLIASIALGFESMARYGLIVWVPVHVLGTSSGNINSLWTSVLMPIGMAIGAFSFGQIADTLFKGNKPACIRVGMIAAGCMALLIYAVPVTNLLVAAVLMFLAGFFVYGPQANFWALCPEMVGEKYVGTSIGIMNMCAYLFAALGEPLLGRVIDLTQDTSWVFVVVAIICLLSAISISISAYTTAGTSPSLATNESRP